jgi:regulator of cell morphogenesis and NO signaling
MTAPDRTLTPVGQLVNERAARARVFEKFDINYGCGGNLPLAQACAARGIPLADVLAALDAADAAAPADDRDWTTAPLGDLITHIEQAHHAFLRAELPRLDFFTHKIANKHGSDRPFLVELREVFIAFKTERELQMTQEEDIVFPRIRQLEQGGLTAPSRTAVENSLAQMFRQHTEAETHLAAMRRLTSNFTPHEGCCNTYRAVFASLAELEADTHLHIHKEHNILFPRALALEKHRSS